eukprot:SAG22_NODE_85_length_21510_cov_6.472187_1_plen_75_part_00
MDVVSSMDNPVAFGDSAEPGAPPADIESLALTPFEKLVAAKLAKLESGGGGQLGQGQGQDVRSVLARIGSAPTK